MKITKQKLLELLPYDPKEFIPDLWLQAEQNEGVLVIEDIDLSICCDELPRLISCIVTRENIIPFVCDTLYQYSAGLEIYPYGRMVREFLRTRELESADRILEVCPKLSKYIRSEAIRKRSTLDLGIGYNSNWDEKHCKFLSKVLVTCDRIALVLKDERLNTYHFLQHWVTAVDAWVDLELPEASSREFINGLLKPFLLSATANLKLNTSHSLTTP